MTTIESPASASAIYPGQPAVGGAAEYPHPASPCPTDVRNTTRSLPARPVRLNCAVPFSDGSGTLIACRNLSTHWRNNFLENHGCVDYSTLSTPQAIQAHVTRDTDRQFAFRETHSRMELVTTRQWGPWLADQFTQMQSLDETSRAIGVNSLNHAMALGLRLGDNPLAGRREYVVQFYDPNSTNAHTEVASDDLAHVATLTADDFVPPSLRATFHGGGVLRFLGKVNATSDVDATWVPALSAAPTPTQFAMLLHSNERVTPYRDALACLPIERQRSILAARPDQGFTGGLAYALSHGHVEAIRDYGILLEQLGIQGNDAYRILLENTKPPAKIIEEGDVATLQAYGELLGRAKLSPASTHDLLDQVLTSNYWHPRTIVALGDMLRASGVPSQVMQTLASVVRSALMCSADKNDVDAFPAYAALFRSLDLQADQVTDILHGAPTDGPFGLATLLRKGTAEAVTAYGDFLHTLNLPPAAMARLMGAALSDDYLYVRPERQRGREEVVAAFQGVLRKLGMTRQVSPASPAFTQYKTESQATGPHSAPRAWAKPRSVLGSLWDTLASAGAAVLRWFRR